MQVAELDALLIEHQDTCMKWVGEVPYWTVLVTTDLCQRFIAWCVKINPEPRSLDARDDTVRIQIFAEAGDPLAAMRRAVAQAKLSDVTLQLLCVGPRVEESAYHTDLGGGATVTSYECVETYPVLHLARNGQKWGK